MKEARLTWFDAQPDLDPERLVFLDETAAATNMVRRHARSPRGRRCRIAVPHGHYKTTTVTAALRASGPATTPLTSFSKPSAPDPRAKWALGNYLHVTATAEIDLDQTALLCRTARSAGLRNNRDSNADRRGNPNRHHRWRRLIRQPDLPPPRKQHALRNVVAPRDLRYRCARFETFRENPHFLVA